MSNDHDYSKEIIIDPCNLEKEWLIQPSYYLYYSESHAEAIYQKDLKKSALDYEHSILYDEVKKDWKKHFDSKPTEVAIKEWIVRNPKHRKAELAFIKATREANVMLNVKTSFDHRKRALENLVSLKITGMYSEPKNKVRQIEKGGQAGAAQRQELNNDNVEGIRVISRLRKKKRK